MDCNDTVWAHAAKQGLVIRVPGGSWRSGHECGAAEDPADLGDGLLGIEVAGSQITRR